MFIEMRNISHNASLNMFKHFNNLNSWDVGRSTHCSNDGTCQFSVLAFTKLGEAILLDELWIFEEFESCHTVLVLANSVAYGLLLDITITVYTNCFFPQITLRDYFPILAFCLRKVILSCFILLQRVHIESSLNSRDLCAQSCLRTRRCQVVCVQLRALNLRFRLVLSALPSAIFVAPHDEHIARFA